MSHHKHAVNHERYHRLIPKRIVTLVGALVHVARYEIESRWHR
jgi:hypothetical protein